MELRHSRPEDAEGLRCSIEAVAQERRWLSSLEAPSVDSVRAFIEAIHASGAAQILALDASAVVGWCDIVAKEREGFRHSGVLGMGVLSAYRGKGLGRRLLQKTLDAACTRGIRRVELEVFEHNAAAIALYEGLGFRREGLKVDARILDGKAESLVCMARLSPEE